jgi:hypothetical protein
MFDNVPARATYKDIIRALKGHYENHQLARIQLSSKSLQETAAAVEQLAH